MAYKVIDVSDWQGVIDWKKVKNAGVVGAIIRYGDGTILDSKFDVNMKNAKAAGLHVGCYIFSRAKTKATAESEATRLYNAAKKYSPDMPLYIDLEAKDCAKTADTVAAAFLNKMSALGGRGGVYANLNWWNNYLKNTAVKYADRPFWIAQYYSKMTYKKPSIMGMWQYSSSGSVNGIKGRVDMNQCYIAYWNTKPKAEPKGYTGKYPDYKLVKSNAKVIADTCKWAKWIAGDNRFHYGSNEHAWHNGCYFCGTQSMKKGHGIKNYEFTYCCNPFVGAAWAHGGGDATAYKMCHNCNSWGFAKSEGYEKSSLFTKLGHPAKSSLKAGDVLCNHTHVALYVGDGKIAEASGLDNNVVNSKRWNDSIHVITLSDSRYKDFDRAYRYKGSVSCDRIISLGEVSDRVADLQNYINWFNGNKALTADGIFGDSTLAAVKKMQTALKVSSDGIVGKGTIEAMKKVKK